MSLQLMGFAASVSNLSFRVNVPSSDPQKQGNLGRTVVATVINLGRTVGRKENCSSHMFSHFLYKQTR